YRCGAQARSSSLVPQLWMRFFTRRTSLLEGLLARHTHSNWRLAEKPCGKPWVQHDWGLTYHLSQQSPTIDSATRSLIISKLKEKIPTSLSGLMGRHRLQVLSSSNSETAWHSIGQIEEGFA